MHNLKTLYRGGLGGHVCIQCRRYASVKGKTYYEVLGVSKTANAKEIKSAYIELSKKFHPDTAGSTSNKKKFTDISEAYSVLSKSLSRKEYDNKLTMESMGGYSSNNYGPYSRPPGTGPASYPPPGGYPGGRQYSQRDHFYGSEGSSYSEYERRREEFIRKARQKAYEERLRQYKEFEESVYNVKKTGQRKFTNFLDYYLSFVFMSTIILVFHAVSSLKPPGTSQRLYQTYLFIRKYRAEIYHSVIMSFVIFVALLGRVIKQEVRDFYTRSSSIRSKQDTDVIRLLFKLRLIVIVYSLALCAALVFIFLPMDRKEGIESDNLVFKGRNRWEDSELRRRYEHFYGKDGQENRRRANASKAEFKTQAQQDKELTRIIGFCLVFALVITLLRLSPLNRMVLPPNYRSHTKQNQSHGTPFAIPSLFLLLYLSVCFVWKKASWHHTDIKKLDRNKIQQNTRSDLTRSPSDEVKQGMNKRPELAEKDITPPRL